MKVTPNGETADIRGPAELFHGTVLAKYIVTAPAPARLQVVNVSFLPGARTAWHSHPYGQSLYVTAGRGLIQLWGEPAKEIKAGDSVWIGAGEKHWHGATSTTSMTHVATHEHEAGQYATWMEHVSEADYAAAQPEAAQPAVG